MIDVLIYTDPENEYVAFRMKGHAGYAEYGKDIVCSAVSVLVINTVNSIEEFCPDGFRYDMEEEKDIVTFEITTSPVSASAQLLLKSLVLGLNAIESEYGKKHVKVHYKKKQEV